jgi:hypothetical protein
MVINGSRGSRFRMRDKIGSIPPLQAHSGRVWVMPEREKGPERLDTLSDVRFGKLNLNY